MHPFSNGINTKSALLVQQADSADSRHIGPKAKRSKLCQAKHRGKRAALNPRTKTDYSAAKGLEATAKMQPGMEMVVVRGQEGMENAESPSRVLTPCVWRRLLLHR